MTLREIFNFILDYPLEDVAIFVVGMLVLIGMLWYVGRGIKSFIDGFKEGYNEKDD
tara:strand:- start:2050 stop:2217 length:168 start_codon:yes stop_codon:yes gene_type:complete